MREPDYLGNCNLLKRLIIGFFSSRTTAPLSVIPTLDWAHEVARREDVAVMSGFQSPMEREVLDILLGSKCGIIFVLNRSLYKTIPARFKDAFDHGRILFISLLKPNIIRPSIENAALRNKFIAETASTLVFSSLSLQSSLYPLSQQYESIQL